MEGIKISVQSLINNLIVVNTDGKTAAEIKKAITEALIDVKDSCRGVLGPDIDTPPQPSSDNQHPNGHQ